jgi:hypothetical protein
MSTWQILLFASVPTLAYLYVEGGFRLFLRYGYTKFILGKLAFYAVIFGALQLIR